MSRLLVRLEFETDGERSFMLTSIEVDTSGWPEHMVAILPPQLQLTLEESKQFVALSGLQTELSGAAGEPRDGQALARLIAGALIRELGLEDSPPPK